MREKRKENRVENLDEQELANMRKKEKNQDQNSRKAKLEQKKMIIIERERD